MMNNETKTIWSEIIIFLKSCLMATNRVVKGADGVTHDSSLYYVEFQKSLKDQSADLHSIIAHSPKWMQPVDSGHIGNQM